MDQSVALVPECQHATSALDDLLRNTAVVSCIIIRLCIFTYCYTIRMYDPLSLFEYEKVYSTYSSQIEDLL
jgi:hypothetical protein